MVNSLRSDTSAPQRQIWPIAEKLAADSMIKVLVHQKILVEKGRRDQFTLCRFEIRRSKCRFDGGQVGRKPE